MLDIKNDEIVISLFTRKIHLINNLKTNMLLKNNIIDFENFVIDMIKRQIVIINIDVVVSLNVRSFKLTIQKSIHLKKSVIMSFHTEMTIVVYHVDLFDIKDFLFESNNNLNITLYAHLIDVFIKIVIVRNDKISR